MTPVGRAVDHHAISLPASITRVANTGENHTNGDG
jgi:hypothetical protein